MRRTLRVSFVHPSIMKSISAWRHYKNQDSQLGKALALALDVHNRNDACCETVGCFTNCSPTIVSTGMSGPHHRFRIDTQQGRNTIGIGSGFLCSVRRSSLEPLHWFSLASPFRLCHCMQAPAYVWPVPLQDIIVTVAVCRRTQRKISPARTPRARRS